MRKIDNIIIHCSDSKFGCAREIERWHIERGFRTIGYHFVILNGQPVKNFYLNRLDGSIECGRYLDGDTLLSENEAGAHALGYNSNSIGICLIGEKNFSYQQLLSATLLIKELRIKFEIPIENILGHYETENGKKQGKTCPNFDMYDFRNMIRKLKFFVK